MSTSPTRMPDYNPSGRRRFKPLRDRADTTPRVGKIVAVEERLLADAIGRILVSGCAVLFSPTSDGGAVSLTVYFGDERARDYAASAEEFEASLEAATDVAEAHSYRQPTVGLKTPVGASEKLTS